MAELPAAGSREKTVLMLVDEFADSGGIEGGLTELVEALRPRGWNFEVFARGRVDRQGQYVRRLNRHGVRVVNPGLVGRVAASSDWSGRERIVRLLTGALAPLWLAAAVGLRLTGRGRATPRARGRVQAGVKAVVNWLVWSLPLRSLDRAVHRGRLTVPKVVHVHGYRCGNVPLGAVQWGRARGLPVIYQEQGVSHAGVDDSAPAGLADVAVAISEAVRVGLVEACGCQQDVRRINYIVPGPSGAPARPRANARPGQPARVATVGRLHEQKGHSTLIEAAAVLARRGVDADYFIAGDGPLRPQLQALVAEVGIADRFQFLGSIAADGVSKLLTDSDIFVMPSRWEALGIAAVEAMAHALPVVASNLEGLGELVTHGHTGLLVESDDAAALADAIERLVRDQAQAIRMGVRGRERYLGLGFDRDSVAEEWNSLYESLAYRPPAPTTRSMLSS